jgi:hypothetical protein
MAKLKSAWKQRLANMTPAEAEAYKKADNARVAAYRAQRKALKTGQPPEPQRASPAVVDVATTPAPATTSPEATTTATTTAPRALFTRYVGICGSSLERGVRPFAEPFHRSDFFEMGLRPTDDVRDVPDVQFSVGERLHSRARLYEATNETRFVFLGVDDRAEEAARKFVATQTRYSAALAAAVAPDGNSKASTKTTTTKRRKHAATATTTDKRTTGDGGHTSRRFVSSRAFTSARRASRRSIERRTSRTTCSARRARRFRASPLASSDGRGVQDSHQICCAVNPPRARPQTARATSRREPCPCIGVKGGRTHDRQTRRLGSRPTTHHRRRTRNASARSRSWKHSKRILPASCRTIARSRSESCWSRIRISR